MSYREKVAWLFLLAIVVTYGPYFTLVGTGYFPPKPLPDLTQLAGFGITTLLQAIILLAGYFILRRRNPDEAKAPLDERDMAIKYCSVHTAYFVLITGMILVGVIMPFESSGWEIVNSALFMIVLAELTQYGIVVYQYRKRAL
jgi:TRAP-type C4-dicarboxylate transport system permease large subunit